MKTFEYKFFEGNKWIYWGLISAIDSNDAYNKIVEKTGKTPDSLY